MPDVPVVFISIEPSPSRREFWSRMMEANTLIKNYISQQTHASFVNVYDLMMSADNQPKPEIFLSDSLHMNKKGYAICKKRLSHI